MADNEVIKRSKRKHVRQPPAVPFLWEESPGVAKKHWRPVIYSVTTLALPSPEKLVASAPFSWEEKPRKPIPGFSQPPMESALTTWQDSQQHDDYNFDNAGTDGSDHHIDKEVTFDSDLESFSFETDYSFSSLPSLLANCLVLSSAVSTAVPVLKTSSNNDINDQLESSSSPASEIDSRSSYETGISSLTRASFLDCFSPLYTPNSAFLGKEEYSKHGSNPSLELNNIHFHHESDSNTVAKRTATLGELITMSRRSRRRKAVQMGTQNLSMVNLQFLLLFKYN